MIILEGNSSAGVTHWWGQPTAIVVFCFLFTCQLGVDGVMFYTRCKRPKYELLKNNVAAPTGKSVESPTISNLIGEATKAPRCTEFIIGISFGRLQ